MGEEVVLDECLAAKKLDVFPEGSIRTSLRKWLVRRREEKIRGEKKGER